MNNSDFPSPLNAFFIHSGFSIFQSCYRFFFSISEYEFKSPDYTADGYATQLD